MIDFSYNDKLNEATFKLEEDVLKLNLGFEEACKVNNFLKKTSQTTEKETIQKIITELTMRSLFPGH